VAAAVAAYHDSKGPHLRPFPDVIPALRKLASTPLIRGIITSGLSVKQAEKLVRLGVTPYLSASAVFISDQIGISKPNPKLFHRACADSGVAPEECMYVGDHPTQDIDPANEIGMATVLMRRAGRHATQSGRSTPRHSVADCTELLTLLSGQYRVDFPPP